MRLLLSFLLLFVAAPTRASTSSSIEGEMTIPYSCAITVPSSQELVVNGAQAQATDTWTFIQNDRTIYSMTPVTISNKPDNAKVIGSITLEYDGGSGGGARTMGAGARGARSISISSAHQWYRYRSVAREGGTAESTGAGMGGNENGSGSGSGSGWPADPVEL